MTIRFKASTSNNVVVGVRFTINNASPEVNILPKKGVFSYETHPEPVDQAFTIKTPLSDKADVSIKATIIEMSASETKSGFNENRPPPKLKTVEKEYLFLGLQGELEPFATSTRKRLEWELKENKRKLIDKLILIAAGFLAFILASFFSLRWFVKRAKNTIEESIQKTKDYRQNAFIKKETEKEVIRQSVRNSMNKADEESVSVLSESIKEALAKGDTETAKALVKILSELNNKPK